MLLASNCSAQRCSSIHSCLQMNMMVKVVFCVSPLVGVCASQVVVPERVNAVLGKNVTLQCKVEVGSNLTLTQSSWERRLPSGSVTVAVYNPQYGISIPPEYIHRLYFRSPSSHDATIVLGNVGYADVGIYTCKVATFPLGNTQDSTTVNILGKSCSVLFCVTRFVMSSTAKKIDHLTMELIKY